VYWLESEDFIVVTHLLNAGNSMTCPSVMSFFLYRTRTEGVKSGSIKERYSESRLPVAALCKVAIARQFAPSQGVDNSDLTNNDCVKRCKARCRNAVGFVRTPLSGAIQQK